MFLQNLEKYMPPNALSFVKEWIKGYAIHIIIKKNRQSKLGDYRKMLSNRHQITINGNLESELFFFVFTHEIAHLLAFEKFGRHIKPHGYEWKHTFATMLLESLECYAEALQPLLLKFAKSPKANFMASADLVKYFNHRDTSLFLENIEVGEQFIFQNERYYIIKKLKKNYLCQSLTSGLKYRIHPLADVEKIN